MTAPPYSVAAWMTPHNGVLEDIEQIAAAGADGVGLWEGKFADGQDDEIRAAMAHHGLRPSLLMPRTWTIIASAISPPGEPRDPVGRTDLICESIARLAAFQPDGIVVGPGTSGDPDNPAGPLDVLAEQLARCADVAAEHGTRISFELLAARRGCPFPTLPSIVEFIDALGRDNIGVLYDVWHSWCEPNVHENIRTYAHRIDGFHVNDVRPEERTWADRVLPGEGRGVAPEMIASFIEAGYTGWYELEIVSDDGTYGVDLPDSLWKLPHAELLVQGRQAFDKAYARALEIVAERTSESLEAQA